tara:strand:+ start:2289 stop:3005 length:717 start_codon:yes stop_codon:yes gene_type:complete
MNFKINYNTNRELQHYEPEIMDFCSFAQKKLRFRRPPTINFMSDEENAKNPLGKTAFYNPSTYEVTIFVDGRHIKDILRSISHELVHHMQNLRGDLDGDFDAGEGYAQKNQHLRNLEKEAYLLGSGIYFRDWEDQYKQGEKLMSEWKEKNDKKLLKEEEIKNPGKYIDGERAKAGADDDGDGVPDGADKDPKDGAVQEESKVQNEHLKKKEAGERLKKTYNARHNRLNETLMKKWFKK